MIDKDKDVTGNSTSVGTVENFIELFRDRYKRLRGVLMNRVNLKDVMEMEFAGEFPHAIKWLVESLKVNFGNFFGDRGLLGRAGAPAKEKAAPSQKA